MSTTNLTAAAFQPLPYEDAAYRKFYANEFIAEFDDGPLATGTIDLEQAKGIVTTLNEKVPKVTQVVTFNAEMLTGEQLGGGACSAISLTIAKGAFKIIAELEKNSELTQEHKVRVLAARLGLLVNEMHAIAKSNNKESEAAKKQLRTLQYAFNAITVDRIVKVAHVVEDKMKALATHFALDVSESTPEVQVSGNSNLESQIKTQTKTLKNGVYLIRVIDFKNNHKMENCGHTITYIKFLESEFYFDPHLGLYQLFAESKKANLIYNALVSAQKKFKVDFMSFHKLENAKTEIDTKQFLANGDNNPGFAANAFDVALLAENSGKKKQADEIRSHAISMISAGNAEVNFTFLTPALTGEHAVGVARYYLEDATRDEVTLGHQVQRTRRLEIDVHYPAIKATINKYKILPLVNKGCIEDSRLLTHSQPALQPVANKKFPIVLFSPGLGNSPDDYQHLIEEIASHGFCVISINHPYSGLYTRFHGTQQVTLARLKEESIIKESVIKADDIAFVINEIKAKKIAGFQQLLGNAVQEDSFGVFGHSLGGTAAVEACRASSHIKGVVDIDGRIIQRADSKKVSIPTLMVIAGKEKKEREMFNKAFEVFQKQNAHVVQAILAANHGDFSLASFYRIKGSKPLPNKFKELNATTCAMLVKFFNEHLTKVSK